MDGRVQIDGWNVLVGRRIGCSAGGGWGWDDDGQIGKGGVGWGEDVKSGWVVIGIKL